MRGELRVPTVFNFLGPLTNPARPYAQVVGVSDERMLPLMAEVLARRGTRAKLFRGEDGLDELTTTGLSTVYDVRDGEVRETHLDPAELGLGEGEPEDLRGRRRGRTRRHRPRDPRRRGRARSRDVVLLNAGAALEVAGARDSLDEGMATAARAIDEARPQTSLERWVAGASNAVASGADDPVRPRRSARRSRPDAS